MKHPGVKHVRGSPDLDAAYVCPGTSHHPIRQIVVGVKSPAYRGQDGKPTPHGIRMSLRQAEAFGRAIIAKVMEVRRWNRAESKGQQRTTSRRFRR